MIFVDLATQIALWRGQGQVRVEHVLAASALGEGSGLMGRLEAAVWAIECELESCRCGVRGAVALLVAWPSRLRPARRWMRG